MFDDLIEPDDEYLDDAESNAPSSASSLRAPRDNPELFGHTAHEKMLLDLFNEGKLPHALIFAGPMGVGKTTTAFRFARFLLKHGNVDDNQDSLFGDAPAKPTTLSISQGDPVYQRVSSGGHPDLRYFERPLNDRGVKKGVLDVETVRKIAPFLRMSSSEGGWRVVIVDEADTMNRNAQNAILKILEEPPPKALLILICNRLGAMIPTIRSRCRTFNFSPLDETTLTTLLKRAAPEATGPEIKLLAALSNGSMGQALTLHEEKGVNTLNTILAFLEGFPNWDWPRIHPMADTLSRADAEKAYLSFTHIMEWICQSFARSKGVGRKTLPEILKTEALEPLENHYSLGQWIEICEKLGAHFTAIETGNLDKHQGIIGAFGIIGGQI